MPTVTLSKSSFTTSLKHVTRMSPVWSAMSMFISSPSPLAFVYRLCDFESTRPRNIHRFWYGLSAEIGMIAAFWSLTIGPPP